MAIVSTEVKQTQSRLLTETFCPVCYTGVCEEQTQIGKPEEIIEGGWLMNLEEQKEWMNQWQGAATALHLQKVKDLRSLSDSEASQAVDSLLSLAGQIYVDPKRWQTSGLVEQQRWFQKTMTT